MPYITVEGNTLEPSQKRALIEQLTATASAIMHVPPEFFLVTINALPDVNIGIGGRPIAVVKAAYRHAHEKDDQR